ncbi:hypothetical protein RCL1_003063 [Eukaryota sp. TZLM3-RCL]
MPPQQQRLRHVLQQPPRTIKKYQARVVEIVDRSSVPITRTWKRKVVGSSPEVIQRLFGPPSVTEEEEDLITETTALDLKSMMVDTNIGLPDWMLPSDGLVTAFNVVDPFICYCCSGQSSGIAFSLCSKSKNRLMWVHTATSTLNNVTEASLSSVLFCIYFLISCEFKTLSNKPDLRVLDHTALRFLMLPTMTLPDVDLSLQQELRNLLTTSFHNVFKFAMHNSVLKSPGKHVVEIITHRCNEGLSSKNSLDIFSRIPPNSFLHSIVDFH